MINLLFLFLLTKIWSTFFPLKFEVVLFLALYVSKFSFWAFMFDSVIILTLPNESLVIWELIWHLTAKLLAQMESKDNMKT